MTDREITRSLREAALKGATPVEIADLLDALCDRGLSQTTLVACFKRAFPSVPLRTLLDAGGWHRIGSAGMTDEEFNELLAPWLPSAGV